MDLRSLFDRLSRRFVPESILETGGIERRRAELTVQTIFALLIWGPFFTVLFYFSFGSPFAALICAVVTVAVVFSLLLLRWTGRGPLVVNFLLGSVYVGILLLSYVNGGLRGPSLTWLALLPLLAMVTSGRRAGTWWLVVSLVTFWMYFALEQTISPFGQILTVGEWQLLYTLALTGLTLIAFGGVRFRGDLQEWLIEELREARDRALEASEAKSEFLARVSHELRTPLTSIVGYSEMLLRQLGPRSEAEGGDIDLSDEQLRSDLSQIQSASQHLLGLVDELLDLSKIEAGEAQINTETVDISPLLDELVETIAPEADKKNNELIVECESIEQLRTDPRKLRQILLNLIDNACKFTDDGTITIRASFAPAGGREHKVALFEVADTGIGIPDDELETVFEAFYQTDSTAPDQRGTGLGLTLVEHFAELLGGDVEVESPPGRGTTFRVRIPDRVDLDRGEGSAAQTG